ncbi:SoxR reducing system RseC family protein [candidate division WOR-3 bacterium]|nr:SoxR reducing system RseC family protein [candidate division WOR-3 bacterium]
MKSMTEVQGKVKEIKGNNIIVEINRDDCEGCSKHTHCTIIEQNSNMNISVNRNDSVSVEIEDIVLIETGVNRIISLSILLYAFPVIMVLIFAIIANQITKSENIVIIISLIGGLIAFAVIYIIDKVIGKKFKHKITRVIK